jgi:uncharacterized protein (DUF488 family)
LRSVIVFTVGHSTRTIAAFLALLREAQIDCLVDVRRFPGSRRHPQFNAEALAQSLAEAGILYQHLPSLGGRRGGARNKESPHTLWREEAFRNYADYAETDEFRAGFATLLALAARHRVAIMCAEAVWWRCHRRIVADYLIAAGVTVMHILDAGKIAPARLTPEATIRPDRSVLYQAPRLL